MIIVYIRIRKRKETKKQTNKQTNKQIKAKTKQKTNKKTSKTQKKRKEKILCYIMLQFFSKPNVYLEFNLIFLIKRFFLDQRVKTKI